MAVCNPQKLVGNWHGGIALDVHTTSSVHVGVDELGHDRFETTYSELGGLLHRLKYKSDRSAALEIVETAVEYLRPRRKKLDLIVPVPPSRARSFQPVIVLARGIGAALEIPVAMKCIGTTRASGELKDVSDAEERRALLIGLYTADPEISAQKNILLFDDVFRSGMTISAVAEVLIKQGHAGKVYAFTITKTRSHR